MDEGDQSNSREENGKDTSGSEGAQSDDKSTEKSPGLSDFAKEYEKLREATLERIREFLCIDRSQTGTGKGTSGSLGDRAAANNTKDDPLGIDNSPVSGPQSQQNSKTQSNSDINNPAIEFGVVDATSTDPTHLNYNRIRVEYHCDTGEITLSDPDGLIEALEESDEKQETAKTAWEYAKFVFDPKSVKELLTEGFSVAKDKLFGPTETSDKADSTADTVKEWQSQDASAFQRGFDDSPASRAERVLTDSGNARCNMPDFKSPGINSTFK